MAIIKQVEVLEERVEILESKLEDSSEEVGRLRRRLNDFIDDASSGRLAVKAKKGDILRKIRIKEREQNIPIVDTYDFKKMLRKCRWWGI